MILDPVIDGDLVTRGACCNGSGVERTDDPVGGTGRVAFEGAATAGRVAFAEAATFGRVGFAGAATVGRVAGRVEGVVTTVEGERACIPATVVTGV